MFNRPDGLVIREWPENDWELHTKPKFLDSTEIYLSPTLGPKFWNLFDFCLLLVFIARGRIINQDMTNILASFCCYDFLRYFATLCHIFCKATEEMAISAGPTLFSLIFTARVFLNIIALFLWCPRNKNCYQVQFFIVRIKTANFLCVIIQVWACYK